MNAYHIVGKIQSNNRKLIKNNELVRIFKLNEYIKSNEYNNKLPSRYSNIDNHIIDGEILSLLSKFKSRYKIATSMDGITIEQGNYPGDNIDSLRIKSYGSMLKFILTYSAFETFLLLFNYKNKWKYLREFDCYKNKNDADHFYNILFSNKDTFFYYLDRNIEDKDLRQRVHFYFESESNVCKNYDNIKLNVYKLIGGDSLSVIYAFRNKMVHGHFTSSYTPKNLKRISEKKMINLYNSMNKLLIGIIDNKFNEVNKKLFPHGK
jgi:hypothetical protein